MAMGTHYELISLQLSAVLYSAFFKCHYYYYNMKTKQLSILCYCSLCPCVSVVGIITTIMPMMLGL